MSSIELIKLDNSTFNTFSQTRSLHTTLVNKGLFIMVSLWTFRNESDSISIVSSCSYPVIFNSLAGLFWPSITRLTTVTAMSVKTNSRKKFRIVFIKFIETNQSNHINLTIIAYYWIWLNESKCLFSWIIAVVERNIWWWKKLWCTCYW